ncbi:MAG: zinc ABC transporter substrate-binding protein [Verrucomicrobia bacterium]|nr:zinc ABC transporter substrate-binding protein [Verrucomicrobiota bacterium]MCH8527232.1 metal ABC transporter substrate-binding protein [Kiritimatiellia bacterium]
MNTLAKRLLAALLISLGLIPSASARLRVTTTTTDLAALAETVGGDRVDVFSLSRPLQDAHYLDATPGMIVRISRSDLFIENGFDLEMGWVPEVLRETRNRNVRSGGPGHVNASNGIQAIQVPERIHRDMGDVHPSGNPHYTLDPIIAQQAARNIADGLIRVDPRHADTYRANLEAFIARSDEVVNEWVARFEPHAGSRLIIYHKHFDYMFERLGLGIADSIEPLPGLAPSARHVAGLIARHTPDTVRMVVMEPWHDQRVGRQVADGIGVPLLILCPTVGSCEGAGDLIGLFETNARKLLELLEAEASE